DSDCCWVGYKSLCRGVCYRGRVEINEKDIDGTCSSTCPDAKTYAVPQNHKCSRIENCRTKESGWKHWFTRCNYCDCDCFTPCALQDRRQ
uniref:Si:ch211-117m20.4 n=1 Tax=Cyprinus carpio carpio TaxID=630221 RepID=A0A9J7XRU5_CYPCA